MTPEEYADSILLYTSGPIAELREDLTVNYLVYTDSPVMGELYTAIVAAIKDAIADERSQCAWIAEAQIGTRQNRANPAFNIGVDQTAKRIADLIRARSTNKTSSQPS